MAEMKSHHARLDEAKVVSLLHYLKALPVTKAERLQLLNLLPQTMVEIYLVGLLKLSSPVPDNNVAGG